MTGRAIGFVVGLALVAVPAWIVYSADDLSRYVETSDKDTVCRTQLTVDATGRITDPGSYAHRRRETATYAGLPTRDGYQRDHVVPICLGGVDNAANVQYQPLPEAHVKDRLERAVCSAVCHDEIPLRSAQEMFLDDAWKASYRLFFGREP